MGLPRDILEVRHGHSEANQVQALFKTNPEAEAPEGFHDRHDSLMRLSLLGISQSQATGEWIRQEFPNGFDAYFTSPHNRTIETAGHLALDGAWDLDDRLRERDWGEFGVLNDSERALQYALSAKLKGQNKWYWCPPGGESLATGVRLRYRDVLDSWHREQDGKQVIAVVHGEVLDVAMFEHERLIPRQWLERDQDPAYNISNCQVFHWTRTDPETCRLSDKLRWRRSICAWDETRSWNNGEWVEFDRKRYSDEELLAMADEHPRLLAE